MNNNLAEQNLQVIRTLMERSAIYRRALGPIMWWAGTAAAASAVLGEWLSLSQDGGYSFFLHWIVTGLAVLIGAFWLARRQARRDREAFWSPPARRVAQAMLPTLMVGLIVTGFFWREVLYAPEPMVGVWAMLYGCALHAAGAFAPRGLRILGWLFLASGLAWWTVLTTTSWDARSSLHLVMGLIFGGLHLGCALYLSVTARES